MEESDTKAGPSQKRKSGKRTARACDECRMRKSKCDGLQPCEACQSTERYCTYNLSAGRSTGSGTRIRILEDRLRRARAYLYEAQKRTPSLANVNFDALLGPTEESSRSDPKSIDRPVDVDVDADADADADPDADPDADDDDDDGQEKLESMMNSYGQMDLNSHGCKEREFYGAASGLAWIQKTRHYFDGSDSAASTPDGNHDVGSAAAVQLFDAPLPTKQALDPDASIPYLLPPRETATHLVRIVFTQVYPMFHFLCEEDFHTSTDTIYSRFPTDYQECDHLFLPLFYFVMALGYLFSREKHNEFGCRACVTEAMRYFVAARNMLDIAHLRTIVSLQAVISLILYLVSTARMASAHAFLGAACAAAMRQGLHFRSTHEADLPNGERRVRRRVFWAVMNLDMYISSILGLPPFMDLSAVDPAIDLTISAALEEGKTGTDTPASERVALMASAKHIELSRVVFKAQRALFPKPIDPPDAALRKGSIQVDVRELEKVEYQFQEWAMSLTDILSCADDSIETQSVKYEMHICYYFAQIVLYRAFLHYLSKQHDEDHVSQRQLSYAQTCVRMAKKVVETSLDHQRRGLLCPASWPSVYTVFISIVCLVFAYATRRDGMDDLDMKRDIEDGIGLLASTACTTDTGSVRCLEILRRLIKRVSYVVDIDFDGICSQATPGCMAQAQGNPSTNLNELHIPARHVSEAERRSPTSSFQPSVASNGHHWSLSPDVTMTQPTFSEMSHSSQGSDQQSSRLDADQMIDIPHGGVFDWHDAAQNTVNDASINQYRRRQRRGLSAPDARLTAQDIAAFMHSNPLDE